MSTYNVNLPIDRHPKRLIMNGVEKYQTETGTGDILVLRVSVYILYEVNLYLIIHDDFQYSVILKSLLRNVPFPTLITKGKDERE